MSHVALARKQCPVCGDLHTHNSEILLDKRLRDNAFPEGSNNGPVTGAELCEEHDKLHKDDYLCLIVLENCPELEVNNIETTWPYRTGQHAHIKREVARELFDIPHEEIAKPINFCDIALIRTLQNMTETDESS